VGYEPPFTSMVAQVTNDAASLTRKSTYCGDLFWLAGAAQGAGCRGILRRLRYACAHRCIDQTGAMAFTRMHVGQAAFSGSWSN